MGLSFLEFLRRDWKIVLVFVAVVVLLLAFMICNSALLSMVFGQDLTCGNGEVENSSWKCVDNSGQMNGEATIVNWVLIGGIISVLIFAMRKIFITTARRGN